MRRLLLSGLVALALLLGGCGNETAPSATVPELADRLAAVDAAVVADDHDRIRTSARRLIAAAEAAGESGELDAGQVESIVAAAEGLLAELPADVEPVEPTTPTPSTTSPSRTPKPSPTPKEEKDEDEEKPGKGKGHGKKDKEEDD